MDSLQQIQRSATGAYKDFTDFILTSGASGTAIGLIFASAMQEFSKQIMRIIGSPWLDYVTRSVPFTVDSHELTIAVATCVMTVLIAYGFAVLVGMQKSKIFTYVKIIDK